MSTGLLSLVCDPSLSPICERPFTVRASGQAWTAATDSRRVLLLAGGEGDEGVFAQDVVRVLGGLRPRAWRVDMAALRAWAGPDGPTCPHCRGSGRTGPANDCARCRGTGDVKCDLGHVHDCPECDGLGDLTPRCAACNGSGDSRVGVSPGTFAPRPDIVIDRRFLGDLVHGLPGESVEVGLTAPDKAVEFRGAGWALLVMPLRVNRHHPSPTAAAVLDLAAIEAPPEVERKRRDASS